jgi:hypothetical protein
VRDHAICAHGALQIAKCSQFFAVLLVKHHSQGGIQEWRESTLDRRSCNMFPRGKLLRREVASLRVPCVFRCNFVYILPSGHCTARTYNKDKETC